MNIQSCIWYNHNALEAVELYKKAFGEVKIISDSGTVVEFELKGTRFLGLNGGDNFRPNAATSFYISFSNVDETQKAWKTLAKNGKPLMPIGKYDWNKMYGWIEDSYGVNWQLWTGDFSNPSQKVVTGLMFCGEAQGKANKAMNFYTKLFPNSEIKMIANYPDKPEEVIHAEFTLDNQLFKAFDSAVPQPFSFSEGVSLTIYCDTQEQIDYYWDNLTQGGNESMCGWCQDRFGVWWQIVPSVLSQLMKTPNKAQRVVQAFLKMKKFDIQILMEV